MASAVLFQNYIRQSRFFIRSIMTTSSKLEKVMEDLQINPYYEKYAQKIATLQKTAPEEFMERIEQKEKEKIKPKLAPVDDRQYTSVLNPKAALSELSPMKKDKKLEDILKIDLVRDRDATEIKQIWIEYHKQKDVIAATIPHGVFKGLMDSMTKYPTFLFPLPRSQGYEFIMSQISHNSVHFTPLLCYQVHKENAPECLTMVHYSELAEDKGLVLMRGEFDKNVIDAKEAQCLANQFQLYYGNTHPKKAELLAMFTNQPDKFKHMDLVAELENLTIQ